MSVGEKIIEVIAKKAKHAAKRAVKPVTEEHRTIARNVLRKAMPISKALELAGYSAAQSRKGMCIVRRSHALSFAFSAEAEKIAKEREIRAATMQADPWRAREERIIARLDSNVKSGRDRAVQSCKLLGSHKALTLWEPEYKTGIVILNAPGPASMLPTPDFEIPEDDN